MGVLTINIRERIDEALLTDDAFRRRRNMRDVPGVTRFPSPQMMSQASSNAWVTWIRDETNKAMMMLDEEIAREGDPDDPFDGTAGGVFELPPGRTNNLSLPPPVHTPTVAQGAVEDNSPRAVTSTRHPHNRQEVRSSQRHETQQQEMAVTSTQHPRRIRTTV